MEISPSLKNPPFFWNPGVHYRSGKNPTLVILVLDDFIPHLLSLNVLSYVSDQTWGLD